MHTLKRWFLALALAAFFGTPGAALAQVPVPSAAPTPPPLSDPVQVMRTIDAFFEGFNKNDYDAMAATFAPSATILDNFAPHYWNGPTALYGWVYAYQDVVQANGITGSNIAIVEPPRHLAIDRGHAFAPVSIVYTYKLNGAPQRDTGVMTFDLVYRDGVWKIDALAWGPTS